MTNKKVLDIPDISLDSIGFLDNILTKLVKDQEEISTVPTKKDINEKMVDPTKHEKN